MDLKITWGKQYDCMLCSSFVPSLFHSNTLAMYPDCYTSEFS